MGNWTIESDGWKRSKGPAQPTKRWLSRFIHGQSAAGRTTNGCSSQRCKSWNPLFTNSGTIESNGRITSEKAKDHRAALFSLALLRLFNSVFDRGARVDRRCAARR